MGVYNVMNNSVYLMINASVPFLSASSNDTIPSDFASLPLAYGFNTVLLSNTSAALLDVPAPDYVTWIQQKLAKNEAWNISAQVHATVASLDTTSDWLNNDTFWKQTFDSAQESGSLSSFQTFQANQYDLGLLLGVQCGDVNPYCLLGYYSGSTNQVAKYGINDPDSQSFQTSAPMKFDVRRELCVGTWKITRDGMELVAGYCTNTPTSQNVWCNSMPYYLDALPVLVHAIGDYSPVGARNSSQWKMPAIVDSVATMYWARLIWMNRYQSLDYMRDTELYYPAMNETIFSTNQTLDAKGLLYFVLCVQPIITVVMFIIALLFYHAPIDEGFGLVTLLSGVNKESLEVLRGAALSGELRKPISLDITVVDQGEKGANTGQIGYSLSDKSNGKASLKRRIVYG